MSEYIVHPKIKSNKIQTRIYQQILFAEAIKKNTLIILPTGLGKTVVMVMVIAHYLKNFDGKIIITAPTRPLVDQHYSTLCDMININSDEIIILSGSSAPSKRKYLWKQATIIIATPQTLRNDIVSGLINLNSVSLLCFDEVHRAVGDDPYVLSAEQYRIKNKSGRVLGFTASPKNKEKLKEIMLNMGFNNIKYMSEDDPRVKPYIHGSKEEWVWIDLTDNIKRILNLLNEYIKIQLIKLKEIGVIKTSQPNRVSKKNIISIPPILNKTRNDIGDTNFFMGMSAYGQLMLVFQAMEMLETQGIITLHSYFTIKKEEYRRSNKKSLKTFFQNQLIIKAIQSTLDLIQKGVTHPKLNKLKEFVLSSIKKSKDSRILIFANYKATINFLVDELESIEGVRVHQFVGQSKSSYGKGLTQKEQKEVMNNFKSGKFNVLVSTSVGEEGLDVAQCDLVIFYDVTPSSTRLIQRSGRTGRSRKGRIIILISKGTRDEAYFYISQKKKKEIHSSVKEVIEELKNNNKSLEQNSFNDYFDVQSSIEPKQTSKTLPIFKNNKITRPIIYIDHREKGSNILRTLLKLELDIKQVELPIGDFIISNRVGIERKTISDFCNSIMDNRLFHQLTELKRTYSKPILILEGLTNEHCRLHKNAFDGAISSIIIDYNIPIVRTISAEDTASLIYSMAKREQIHKERKAVIRTPSNNETIQDDQINLISALPNINIILAEKLLLHFSTPRKLLTASPELLRKVHGIGKNISDKIDELLSTSFQEELL